MTLRAKSVKSLVWLAARNFGRQLVNSLLFFWIALVLSPEQVGFAALAVAVPVFLQPVVTRGFYDAVIQSGQTDATLRDTAFWTNLGLGGLLSGMLFAATPLLTGAFGAGDFTLVFQAAAAIPLVTALGAIPEALFARVFHQRAVTVAYTLGSVLAAIPAALVVKAGHGVWVLVIYTLGSSTITSVALLVLQPVRPGPAWRAAEARRQLRFALPVMLSTTIAVGNQRIAELLIGAFLTPLSAAIFRFGGNFPRLLTQMCVAPVMQVLLPAFARSTAGTERNIRRSCVVVAALSLPVFHVAAGVLPDLVPWIFGPDWALGGWVGAILCYSFLIGLPGQIVQPMLIAEGKTTWTTRLTVASLLATVLMVLAGAAFGVVGVAVGFVARGIVTIPLTLYVARRELAVPPGAILCAIAPFALAAVAINLVAFLWLSPALSTLAALPRVTLLGALQMIFYLGLVRVVVKRAAPDTYQMLLTTVPERIGRFL